jgi:hypothetical protein
LGHKENYDFASFHKTPYLCTKEGKKIIGTELLDYTLGGKNQTSAKKHKPMKSEAHLSLANE